NLRKTESRRRRHESEAVMRPAPASIPAPETAAISAEWITMLDAALHRLPTADRDAVLLHFMEQRNFEETGSAMGITAEAARKRTTRALDRLRAYFSRLGFGAASMSIGPVLSATRRAAPGRTVNAAVSAVRGHGSSSVVALANGASHMMEIAQLKLV